MEPEQSAPLEYILAHVSIGLAILDADTLRVLYINPYCLSLLEEPWRSQGATNHALQEVLPSSAISPVEVQLRRAIAARQTLHFNDVPYEGFLETRGRTYWNVEITPDWSGSLNPLFSGQSASDQGRPTQTVLITLEDVTNKVRARMHIDAIHYISSAIAGPFALPQVLDRILQAVQELVGSTRCAILLLEDSISGNEAGGVGGPGQDRMEPEYKENTPSRATIAAQKGLHLSSQGWRPRVGEHLLLGQVMQMRRSLVIPNTNLRPEIEYPLLDDNGTPRRPGSVLCVPIFEPVAGKNTRVGAILGTIEVYHRRVRGLPAEEVELLEQFAQQVGLAIQNARFFLSIDRLARDARRQARQRENVMQAIPDGVILYDARWRVADINSAIRQLMGWSDDVIGLHIREALERSSTIYLDRSPSVQDMVTDLELRPNEKPVDEFKMIGADGKIYSMRRSKAPIQDDQGNIFAYVVLYHDVTEQATAREQIEAQVITRTLELAQRNKALEEAQDALELEHSRLELLLARLPSGVLLVSANDNRVNISNRQAARLLQRMGWKPTNGASHLYDDLDFASERLIGMNVEDLFRNIEVFGDSGEALPYEQQPLYLALHKGEASEAELHFTPYDDQSLYLLVNAAPLRSSDGTITDAVLVMQDITRLKTLERAREDFFTSMAHELKTPLANIRAHLSALQVRDYEWSTDDQMKFLQTADEQVERLVGMINHFLDASRVEAGALRLNLEPVLLPELFEDLQERLEALISSSNRRLEIDISPDAPAVLADYELIISVLTNLLSNAFRYAPEGDIVRLEAVSLYATGEERPTGIELRVVDRGSGITPERQAELFTRFSTFAATRRPAVDRPGQPEIEQRGSARWSPATGLGLYISRGIIEAHGSKLTLHSVPGEGTTFAFVLGVASLVKHEVS
ncbi:MAG TPA: PAS domain-containing protein [Ktedonobacteraceae bacterium]|nr:PAS domain-containing protein [Ktedonobacteraceae bacterium]